MYTNIHLLPAVIKSFAEVEGKTFATGDGVTVHTKQLRLRTKSTLFILKSEKTEGSVRDDTKYVVTAYSRGWSYFAKFRRNGDLESEDKHFPYTQLIRALWDV